MNKLYITIAGKSNVGKSSFINHLCNNYVTPESSKLQTTRITGLLVIFGSIILTILIYIIGRGLI